MDGTIFGPQNVRGKNSNLEAPLSQICAFPSPIHSRCQGEHYQIVGPRCHFWKVAMGPQIPPFHRINSFWVFGCRPPLPPFQHPLRLFLLAHRWGNFLLPLPNLSVGAPIFPSTFYGPPFGVCVCCFFCLFMFAAVFLVATPYRPDGSEEADLMI